MPRSLAVLLLLPPVCARVVRINFRSMSRRVGPESIAGVTGAATPSGSRWTGISCGVICSPTEDDHPFNSVFQLAYITGPIIAHENIQNLWVKPLDVLAVLDGMFLKKMTA